MFLENRRLEEELLFSLAAFLHLKKKNPRSRGSAARATCITQLPSSTRSAAASCQRTSCWVRSDAIKEGSPTPRVTSTTSPPVSAAAEGGENKAGVCSRAGVFLVPQLGCEKLFTCKHRLPPRGRTGTEGRSKMRQVRVSILALGGAVFWGVGQEGSPVNASWFLVGSGRRWDQRARENHADLDSWLEIPSGNCSAPGSGSRAVKFLLVLVTTCVYRP